MQYDKLMERIDFYRKHRALIPGIALENYEEHFAIDYTHNSTAIEGNTLSLLETRVVLVEKESIGGKTMRELFEIVNHDKAYRLVSALALTGNPLSENVVLETHRMLMDNIREGGVYRKVNVWIGGAKHIPPTPLEMQAQLHGFYSDLPEKTEMNPIELAAWTHAEFVKIHPFADGNGRTARLLMNYQLMSHDCLPVSIPYERRREYYETLEAYDQDGALTPLASIIAELEHERLDTYHQAIEAMMEGPLPSQS